MKSFFKFSFIFLLFDIVALVILAHFWAAPQIKDAIEKYGSQYLHTPVIVGDVDFKLWPLSLVIKDLRTHPTAPIDANVSLGEGAFYLDFREILSKRLRAKIILAKLQTNLNLPQTVAGEIKNNSASGLQQSTVVVPASPRVQVGPIRIDFSFEVADSQIIVDQGGNSLALRDLKIQFMSKDLNEGLFQAYVSTHMEAKQGGIGLSLPVNLASEFSYVAPIFKTDRTSLNLGGLDLRVVGNADLSNKEQKWDATVDIPELKNLEVPPAFLPAGKWSGRIYSRVHAEYQTDWVANGSLKLQSILGQLNFKTGENQAQGGLGAEADVDFSFSQKILKLTKIIASINLSDLDLTSGRFLRKPRGTPLDFSIDGMEAGNTLTVKESHLTFAQMRASAWGNISSQAGASSSINIDLPRTSLAGLEKFIPLLNESPLLGFLELKAAVSGDLQNPQNLNVSLNPLNCENLRAKIHWESPDKKEIISGPASFNAKALIVAQGKILKTANIVAQADLSGLDISSQEEFQKRAGVPLKLDIVAHQKGILIEVSRGVLNSSAGSAVLKGFVRNPQSPEMNLKMQSHVD